MTPTLFLVASLSMPTQLEPLPTLPPVGKPEAKGPTTIIPATPTGGSPPNTSRREILLPEYPELPVIPGDTRPVPPPIIRGALPDLPPPPRVGRTPTLKEFARDFAPREGVHEVRIIHPVTDRPIDVTFKLPPGQPRVWLYNRSIVFQYPRGEEIQILFRIFGRADVRYE